MFGFSFLYSQHGLDEFSFSNPKAKKIISSANYIAVDNMIDKFENDKIFYDSDDFLIILDGVILNKKDLITTEKSRDEWIQTIISLYRKDKEFFHGFRGSFSGVLYDKKEEYIIVFSDHIGTKFIYYIPMGDAFFITSMMSEAYSFLKQNAITYSMSIESAYLLLSYGYMLEDRTLCDKIRKIRPGCYLYFEHSLREKRYCLLDNTPDNTITERDAIELIDKEFRRAVSLEFDKDDEYGYQHLVGLSAGLDSRMTSWVAHEMGYKTQCNFTFSQTNYWDETIPKKIAEDLKHEWIFKSLDNGLWLYPVDKITRITGGNVLYYGLAHSLSLYECLNFEKYGMIHTGQLGDVIVGTWYSSINSDEKFKHGDGAYSSQYIYKIKDVELEQFANQEIAKFYHRGFSGTNNGQLSSMAFTETCSPFMDWDFMNSVMKIPVKFRFGHHIYKEWIINKYPRAAEYVWEKLGFPINKKYGIINYKGHQINIFDIPSKLMSRFNSFRGQEDKKNMNPIGYYISSNKELFDFIENYFVENMRTVDNSELNNVLKTIHDNDSYIEKIQAISLLSAYKLYFRNV